MVKNTDNQNGASGALIASLIIGISLIVCAVIASQTLISVKGMGKTIRVTGAAVEPIRSDYAIWEGHVSVQTTEMAAGYAKLKADMEAVALFMRDAGFEEDQYEIGTVSIYERRNRDNVLTGYALSQEVKVEMENVDRIAQLAKNASTLIEKGVMMESRRPRFLFTGLDTLKIEMIRRATENAKLRAQQLAETTGREVGPPTSAGVGVFQIRPRHSQEVSGYGISDVTSIDKEIVSTVHIDFLIE